MSTVSFSVPDDVKEAFNDTSAGQNKSAVVADLMREAVQRAHANQSHAWVQQRLLESGPRHLQKRTRLHLHRPRVKLRTVRGFTGGGADGCRGREDD